MITGRPLSSEKSTGPYKLRAILYDHALKQGDLASRLTYQSGVRVGQRMSHTTISTLITRRVWPMTLPRELIESTTAQFLREHNVPDAIAATAWEIEGDLDPHAGSSNSRSGAKANSEPEQATSLDLPENEMLSPAAKEHFKLATHPFVNDVQGPQDVYLSRDQRYVRESMYYAAKHAGLLAIIGESGSGKTTLRRDLLDRLRRDNERIVVIQPQTIDKKALTAAHICDAIIADLSAEQPKLSLEAKARQIQRILAASAGIGHAHVLIIEEAHDLSNPTIKYLKRFWEMEDGFKKLIGVVLVGQPELALRLDEQRNPDLREFIRRCEVARLKSLNGNLEEYLALKFKRIGLQLSDVFAADAFDAIRARLTRRRQGSTDVESHLYPLVINNLVAKAMNLAVELGASSATRIDAQLVGRV